MTGPCESAPEDAVFRASCSSTIATLHAMRARQRYARGLVIRWRDPPGVPAGTHTMGVGHLLELAFRAHDVCARLERYCYMSIFDADFDHYFGYADGQSWGARAKELRQYAAERQVRVDLEAPSFELADQVLANVTRLARAHATASLIDVSVRGLPPLFSDHAHARLQALSVSLAMASDAPTPPHLHRLRGLDPCLCRYVTQPRLPGRLHAIAAGWSPAADAADAAVIPATATEPDDATATGGRQLAFPRHAVHLRSGLADALTPGPADSFVAPRASGRASGGASGGASGRAAQSRTGERATPHGPAPPMGMAALAGAACGGIGQWRDPTLIISDSDALVRSLASLNPRAVRALNYRTAAPAAGSRTWGIEREAKFRALDALVAAGMSSTLHIGAQRTPCYCSSKGHGGAHFLRARGLVRCPQYSLTAANLTAGGARGNAGGRVSGRAAPRRALVRSPRWCDSRVWSYFHLPLVTRSVCLTGVALAVPGCEGYAQTFVRDLPRRLIEVAAGKRSPGFRTAASPELALAGLRWAMGAHHPCANLSAAACLSAMVSS